MTKQQLIESIRNRINGGISRADVERVLDGLGVVATTTRGSLPSRNPNIN
jgi:nucleoid DNA-binding protein